MYRNVEYNIIDRCGYITEWTWDEHGNPITLNVPHTSYLYYEHPQGNYMSAFGTTLIKKEFNNTYDRKKWLESFPDKHIFESLNPIREYLINKYENINETAEFCKYPLRVNFFDIEVAIEDCFPSPDLADYPINVITSYDSKTKEYHTFVLSNEKDKFVNKDEYWKDVNNIVFHVYNTEQALLVNFIKWYKANRPDILTGWNILGFDIPYLINRLYKVIGDKDIVDKYISEIGKVRNVCKQVRVAQTGQTIQLETYSIGGVSLIDYMILYRDKFPPKERIPNYKLDTVSMHELGVGKLEYEGTMKTFYKTNFRKFVLYNIIDVVRIVEIEEKLQLLVQTRNMCNIGLTEYETIYTSAPYIYGAIVLQAHKENVIMLSDNRINKEDLDISFEGAYVFPTKVGVYRNGITSFDLNSLYPSIMIALNISPETKIGKIITENADGSVVVSPQRQGFELCKTMDKDKFAFLCKNSIKSSNNVLYCKHSKKTGIVPKFLIRLYDLRVSYKKQQKEFERLYKETGVQKYKDEAKRCDIFQLSTKIFLNSIYGQFGSKYFPLFDVDNAQSVTISGQTVNKNTAKFIENVLGEGSIIAGDTDSLYIDAKKLTDKLKVSEYNDDNVRKICTILDKLLVKINDNCNEITKQEFNSDIKDRIKYSRETFCCSGTFTAKKRYILHIRDKEGTLTDSWKAMGLEIKKSELPKRIKKYLEEIIKISTDKEISNSEFKAWLEKIWDEYLQLPLNDIAIWKGYNTEKKSKGFVNAEKGATLQAKGAIYYNQLIDKLKVNYKYNTIKVGDKIQYVYVNPMNQYGIDVIAWVDTYPVEFNDIFQIDYVKMFQKEVLNPLKIFKQIHNWSDFCPSKKVLFDVTDL